MLLRACVTTWMCDTCVRVCSCELTDKWNAPHAEGRVLAVPGTALERLLPTSPVFSLSLASAHNIGAVTRMPRFPLPDKFADGDFQTFKKLFNRVSAANSWNDEQKLSALPLCLQGRALSIFEKNEDNLKTVTDALKYLEEEFSATSDKECALKEFYLSSWGPGLDLDVYAQRLSNLLRRGIPSLGDDDHNRIVANEFINGFP